MMDTDRAEPTHWVTVRFGRHVIANYSGPEALANRYAAAMQRRFPGLRVTAGPIPPYVGVSGRPSSNTSEQIEAETSATEHHGESP